MRTLSLLPLIFALACDEAGRASYDPNDPGGSSDGPTTPDPSDPTDSRPPGDTFGLGDGLATMASSGSRLKRRIQVGQDGSEQFIGWWDDDLSTPCDYATASDGRSRCLPSGPTRTTMIDSGYFADADCSQRVLYRAAPAPSCASAPTWYVSFDTCQQATVRQHMSLHTGSLYMLSSGVCTSIPRVDSLEYRIGGSTVQATSFVAGDVELR